MALVWALTQSHRSGLNRRPPDYESGALPLSYCGDVRTDCRPEDDRAGRWFMMVHARSVMPWRGLEPRRLSAPPPQDGVSTNFTTRATRAWRTRRLHDVETSTGLTGLEPATSGVTDRH